MLRGAKPPEVEYSLSRYVEQGRDNRAQLIMSSRASYLRSLLVSTCEACVCSHV